MGQIDFKVIVQDTLGEPIGGAQIDLLGPETQYKFTDAEGNAKFSLVKGVYILDLRSVGYSDRSERVELIEDRSLVLEMSTGNYSLPEIELSGLSLTSRRDFAERSGPTSYFLSSEYLDQIRTIDVHQSLQRIPGVQIQEEEGFGLRPNIGIRGSGASRSSKILVMEDGVPTAPAPYSAPAAYYFPTMGRMDGLEVRMGSASLMAGPYTTGGAINLLSTPVPRSTDVQLRAGLGSFNTRQVNFKVGDEIGRLGYMVEYFGQSSDGFKSLDGPNDATGHDKRDIHIKTRYLLSNSGGHRHQLSAKFLHSQETSNETYLGLTRADFDADPYRRYAGSERDVMNTEFTGGHLTHTWTLPASASVVTTVYGHTFARNWYKLDKVSVNGSKQSIANILDAPNENATALAAVKGMSGTGAIFDVKANNREYYSYGLQSRFKWQHFGHGIQAGLRLHTDQIDRFQWVDEYQMQQQSLALVSAGLPGTESNRVETSRVGALFWEYSYETKAYKVSLGARGEYINATRKDYGKRDVDRTGSDLSERENSIFAFLPGASAEYNIGSTSQVFASVVRGFTPPGNSEDAQPEESINTELGYRLFQGNKLQMQLTGFWHEYENLLGSQLVGGGAPDALGLINGGAARSMGVEAYVKYVPHPRWPIEASYTYIHSSFREAFDSDFGPWGQVSVGDRLPYVSPNSLWLQVGYQGNRWGIFSQFHFQSAMLAETSTDFSSADEGLLVGERGLLSIQAQYDFPSNIRIYGRVNNLLDEAYSVALRPAGWRPGMPRYIECGVEYRFRGQ